MKKSFLWQGAILACGASLLMAGCGSKDPGFAADIEEALRLLDDGKNAEAYALLDAQCGDAGTTSSTDPYFGQCRDLLGDAKAAEAGLNWFEFIGAIPEEGSTEEFEITDVVAEMTGATDVNPDPNVNESYLPVTELADKKLSIEEALEIHAELTDTNADGVWDIDPATVQTSLGGLSDAEKAQLAMEASMYILYTVSGDIATENGAPMSLDALQVAVSQNEVSLTPEEEANLAVAVQLVVLGSGALGEDNEASAEFDKFLTEGYTDNYGVYHPPIAPGSEIDSASINNYLSML